MTEKSPASTAHVEQQTLQPAPNANETAVSYHSDSKLHLSVLCLLCSISCLSSQSLDVEGDQQPSTSSRKREPSSSKEDDVHGQGDGMSENEASGSGASSPARSASLKVSQLNCT